VSPPNKVWKNLSKEEIKQNFNNNGEADGDLIMNN
jgi:hypothetical protein